MKNPPLSGRYELEEIVGTGGMSVVYRAWDLKSDREVAIKVLRVEYLSDEEFVRQFNREAQAASQMSHPNIVYLYDVGQDGDTRYLVMEYVKGATLKDIIRQQGKIAPKPAVVTMLKVLAALDHAHKNNIVHRDIKPQNILVDMDHHVKVADFGIARVVNSSSNTKTSNVFGSVHYFSPEQANGAVADAKSDLYSAGVVLYEMLTGRVPFDAETPMAVARKHIEEDPVPPSVYNPEVSKGLDEVVLKALAKNADDRYQTAAEMATDLKRALKMPMGGFLKKKGAEQRQPRREKWTWVSYLTLAVIILLAAGLAFGGWRFYEKLKTRVRVPTMLLADAEDAVAQLEEQGLLYDIQQVYNDAVISGAVIAQSPQAGAMAYPGDLVTLTVSLGREYVVVPDVRERSRNEAVQLLEEADLTVGDVRLEISDDVPVGAVITQSPAPDENVPPFTDVSLVVSGESAAVPDLMGLSVDLARVTLQASGLQLGSVTQRESDQPAGSVIEQSFDANVRVLWGVAVDVVISETDDMTYWENVSLPLDVPENDTVVKVLLCNESTDREVYRNVLNAGPQTIVLNLDSDTPGVETLRVFVADELVLEQSVAFGDE